MSMQENAIKQNTAPVTEKRRSTIVISVVLAFAIVLCILVIGQVLSKGYVSLGGYSLFRVVTGSMEPSIPVGAVLIAEDTSIQEIKAGDVVTFRSRDTGMFHVIITHRVISVQQGSNGKLYLETKGDANPYADASYVDEDYLIGKVTFHTGQNNIFTKLLNFKTTSLRFFIC